MFAIERKPNPVKEEIDRLIAEMTELPTTSDIYQKNLDAVVKLTPLLPKPQSKVPSTDVVIGSLTNLVGIGAVLHHERLNVITSKAFSWIRKS
jgi:hypothetical protein